MNETIYDEEGKGEGWEREGPKLLLNQGPSESCYATDKAGGCTPAPKFLTAVECRAHNTNL